MTLTSTMATQPNVVLILADDMGLGKTVQTLALLQSEKEKGNAGTSLLIMPTSLVYNWEMEASRFTPELKILTYTGTQRNKDVSRFAQYDVVLSSYGITRLDIELFQNFHFNYIILDESQAIKNPLAKSAKAARLLHGNHRIVLTGTPVENHLGELWAQFDFLMPGFLGDARSFKRQWRDPIEVNGETLRARLLADRVRPFILRRRKAGQGKA